MQAPERYQALPTYSRAGYLAWPRMRASIRVTGCMHLHRGSDAGQARRELWSPSISTDWPVLPSPQQLCGASGGWTLGFCFLPSCLLVCRSIRVK